MPGHMQAAIAAYPELGSLGDTPVVSPDWGVHKYLLNVDDATIAFIDNVLDEVVDLFPGPFVHIGGDEAVKDQWKSSPPPRWTCSDEAPPSWSWPWPTCRSWRCACLRR